MVRGCTFPAKQRLNELQKYNVNYHFASHAPINMKTLILEGIYMTTTISLRLCNHHLRNIIIVSHDPDVVKNIKHRYKTAKVENAECVDVISSSEYNYGSMWLDCMNTMRTQYNLFMLPFKLKKLSDHSYVGFTYSLRGCSRKETNKLLKSFEYEVLKYGYTITHDITMKNNENKRGNQMYTTFYNVRVA